MANIPLRPLQGNFFGAFVTPAPLGVNNGDYDGVYSSWDFDLNFKAQIDAVKSIGGNCVAYFGSSRLTTSIDAYLVKRRQIVEYLARLGMYAMPYQPCNLNDVNNATACSIMAADAQMMSAYPNVVGYVTSDEPWQFAASDQNNPPGYSDAQIRDFMAEQYAAVKAVVPASFPVAAGANPCGNTALPVWRYDGEWKDKLDLLAPYLDFFAFHPFDPATLADSAALRAAYPGKQIFMPSSVLSQEGDGDITSKANSIMSLSGANNFRGMCWFLVRDFAVQTWGLFNSDFSPRTQKTGVFTAGINNTPKSQHRRYPGKPRLSQLHNWGYR